MDLVVNGSNLDRDSFVGFLEGCETLLMVYMEGAALCFEMEIEASPGKGTRVKLHNKIVHHGSSNNAAAVAVPHYCGL